MRTRSASPGQHHKNFLIGVSSLAFLLVTLGLSVAAIGKKTTYQSKAWSGWFSSARYRHGLPAGPSNIAPPGGGGLQFNWPKRISYLNRRLVFSGELCNYTNQRRTVDVRMRATSGVGVLSNSRAVDVVYADQWNRCYGFGLSFGVDEDRWCRSPSLIPLTFEKEYKLYQDQNWTSLGSTTVLPTDYCPASSPTPSPVMCLAPGQPCNPDRPNICCGICSPSSETSEGGICTEPSPIPTATAMSCYLPGEVCRVNSLCCSKWCNFDAGDHPRVGRCGDFGPRPNGAPCNENSECQSDFCDPIQDPEPGFSGECRYVWRRFPTLPPSTNDYPN